MKKPRLSDAVVRTIRHLGRNTDTTYRTLAARFGVSESCIGQVVRGALYAHVADDSQDESLDEFLETLGYDEPEVTIEEPLAVGDVVQLKSGSPRMTVERGIELTPRTRQPFIVVNYWTDSGVVSDRLHPDTVERVA